MLILKRSMIMTGIATSLFFTQGFAESTTEKAAAPKEESKSETTDKADLQKLSETFGNFIGKNLNSSGISFDLESFIQGIRDGSSGKAAPMSDQEFEEEMAKIQEKAFKNLAENNLKAAEKFLADNMKAKNIVEIVPGKLQYEIIKEGAGQEVKEHDIPQIQYTGKYIDGSVFGSSEETGGPINLPLDQTIPGFSKGIIGMKEGEKRRLFIHPELGYGSTGQLPPNSLLIFEVEVLKSNTGKDDEQTPLSANENSNTIEEGSEEEELEDIDNEEATGKKEEGLSKGNETAQPSEVILSISDVQNIDSDLIAQNQQTNLKTTPITTIDKIEEPQIGSPDVNDMNPLINPDSKITIQMNDESKNQTQTRKSQNDQISQVGTNSTK